MSRNLRDSGKNLGGENITLCDKKIFQLKMLKKERKEKAQLPWIELYYSMEWGVGSS